MGVTKKKKKKKEGGREGRETDGSTGAHFFHDEKQFYLLRESGFQILAVVKVVFNCELTEGLAGCCRH